MASEVSFSVLAAVRSVARVPGIAGLCTVSLRGEVAHGLEGVAAVGEVPGAVGEAFEFPGLDLGAVLLALEILNLWREPVAPAVEALDLGV